jgi:hypothetical protein
MIVGSWGVFTFQAAGHVTRQSSDALKRDRVPAGVACQHLQYFFEIRCEFLRSKFPSDE